MLFDESTLKDLVKGKTKEEIFGKDGLIKNFVKSVVESARKAEMDTHLGYEKYDKNAKEGANSRNGFGSKIIKGEFGEALIDVPRVGL